MPQLPTFGNPQLLHQALTHRSYANEHPQDKQHNERLEFLGDAVLNFLSGELLYKTYPDRPEGELTVLRSSLVDEAQLAKFAIALDLGSHLKLGKGVDLGGGRQNPNLLSSAFEAVIGAYYLDHNSKIEPVREFVTPFFQTAIATLTPTTNYKSELQEWALMHFGPGSIPKYAVIAESGPDHAKEFVVEVRINGVLYGQGMGRKKQDAEKAAARNAINKIPFEKK